MSESIVVPAKSGTHEFRVNGGTWKVAKPAVIAGKRELAEELGASFEERVTDASPAVMARVSDVSDEPAKFTVRVRATKENPNGENWNLDLTESELEELFESHPNWDSRTEHVNQTQDSEEAVLSRGIRILAKLNGESVGSRGAIPENWKVDFRELDDSTRAAILATAKVLTGREIAEFDRDELALKVNF